MATIHNGFVNKDFIDSFKDTGLNNVDLATTKMYKGVKPMWKQLGFNSDNFDNPDSKFFWKNIIPKHYTYLNIDGITVKDVPVEESISGSVIPRISSSSDGVAYKKIIIDDKPASLQSWQGINPETNNREYYYPEIPKLNKFGIFKEEFPDGSMFYGAKETWDGDDDSAPITNLNEVDDMLILNLDFQTNITDDIVDITDVNKISYNKDFQLTLDNNLRLKTDTLSVPDGIERDKSQQAF